jgi:hypothetical protein
VRLLAAAPVERPSIVADLLEVSLESHHTVQVVVRAHTERVVFVGWTQHTARPRRALPAFPFALTCPRERVREEERERPKQERQPSSTLVIRRPQ